jgi:hypothetical protein
MASLLVAAGLYTHGKIRDKKEAKKEKKRKAYEARYNELEAEHKVEEEKHLQRRNTVDSKDPEPVSDQKARRSSSDSQRDRHSDDEDGPGQWVEAALRKRTQSMG